MYGYTSDFFSTVCKGRQRLCIIYLLLPRATLEGAKWKEQFLFFYLCPNRGGQLAILRPFNSILVILGRWVGDNERLCAKEPVCD